MEIGAAQQELPGKSQISGERTIFLLEIEKREVKKLKTIQKLIE